MQKRERLHIASKAGRSNLQHRGLVCSSLFVLCLLLLLSCSTTPAAPWPEGAPPRVEAIAEKPITLRVWLAADYTDQAPIRDVVAAFQAAYPNIKVELTGYIWEEMADKVRLAISQGAPPDVAHQHAFAMGAQGMAEPLDELWQQWGAADQFMPGALEDITWQGRRYGVPLDINTLFMIYNRAAFAEAGLQPPGPDYTFERLHGDLQALTSTEKGRFGMAISSSGWYMYGMLRGNGGELLEERGTGQPQLLIDSPRVVETVRFFASLGQQQLGTLPPPQPRQSDHPVALFFSGPWDLTRLRKEAPAEVYAEVGTAPLRVAQAGATGSSVQGGGSLFVPSGAANRQAAFEFMKWAVSDSYALRMAKEMGRYPVRSALYNDPYFSSEPLLLPFLEQLKTARPYKLDSYAAASQIWSEAVRAAFSPDADVDAILRQAQQQAQQAINSGQ